MSLGHDLGADQNIDLPFGHGADGGLHFRRTGMQRRHGVGRGNGITRIREKVGELLRHPLDPGAAGNQHAFALAFRAGIGGGDFMPALMTGQPLAIAMFHQPGRTMGAGELVAAALA